MTERLTILKQIDQALKECKTCEKLKELEAIHGKRYSHIDGYCNKECPNGQQLQEFGTALMEETRQRERVTA